MKNLVAKPKPEEKGARRLILRVLNARVSLPSWMLALSSAALGWAALILLLFGSTGLGPFGVALPFSGNIWVPLLIVATNATVAGLLVQKWVRVLRFGAFASFVMWIFGGFAFLVSGNIISAVVIVLPWMIFYAYVYLASFFRDETGI